MALTLNKIFHATQTKYHLDLICGEAGLNRIMNWVYISEDINTADFLRGGELIITTGVSCKSPDWLFHFVLNLIEHHTCGLIINFGDYLSRKDITEDIIEICEKNDFPLLSMPWEIHIYDITRDYYNRIFLEAQTDTTIVQSLLSIMKHDSHMTDSLDRLEEHGYVIEAPYCTCCLDFPTLDVSSGNVESNIPLLFIIESFFKMSPMPCHITTSKNLLLLIICESDSSKILGLIEDLATKLRFYCKNEAFYIGIGGIVNSLMLLSKSYEQAIAALTMSKYQKAEIYSYEQLGFFKLLLAVNDRDLLTQYMNTYLGNIITYDAIHHSNYLETLDRYLTLDGSIQAVAAALFCHRNTISYRINILRDILGHDLDSSEVRFNLKVAFLIKEYLRILG